MHKILNRSQGFSLIELMIAVAIIGILAAIAIPMYSDYVTSSRRADGQATLIRIAQELERCYTQFSKYNDNSCSVVTGGAVNETSDQGYYTISSSAGPSARLTESTFILTATPQNEQTDDTDCAILQLTHLGIKNATGPDRQGCW